MTELLCVIRFVFKLTFLDMLSMSSLESMRHVLDLLSDMLQAVNPSDRAVSETVFPGLLNPPFV